jgi:hypothetical protein
MYLKFLILFTTIQISLSAIDDIKVITSNIDIKEEEHVISTVFNLFENEKELKIITKKLVDEMDTKFGKTWIGQIGSNNNSELYINQELSSFITLSFKEMLVTLYKITLNNENNNSTNFNAVYYILNSVSYFINS